MSNWASDDPRPIRPSVHLEAPGANVRLLGMTPDLPTLSRVRSNRLWELCLEDMAALTRDQQEMQAELTAMGHAKAAEGVLAFLRRVGR